MLVRKFGGTSLANYDAMRKVINIIKNSNDKNGVIILSACSGVTDLLIDIAELSIEYKVNKKIIDQNIFKIDSIHKSILNQSLIAKEFVETAFSFIDMQISDIKNISEGIGLLEDLSDIIKDKLVVKGELLSSYIFNSLCNGFGLSSILFDARDLIKIQRTGEVSDYSIDDKALVSLKELCSTPNQIIIQGFIASDENGNSITLGRGGSDYSASIIGKALDSKSIEIWTDVNGLLSADPRIVKNTKTITSLSYFEIRNMAYWGAKVLHYETLVPAIESNIPIKILNTFNPKGEITTITKEVAKLEYYCKSIILKKDVLYLYLNKLNLENDFLMDLDLFFNKFEIKVLYSVNSDKTIEYYVEIHNSQFNTLKEQLNIENIEISHVDILIFAGLYNLDSSHINIFSKLLKLSDIQTLGGFHYSKQNGNLILLVQNKKGEKMLKLSHQIIFN